VKLESRIADLVNLESAFTDALCVVGASACIAILTRGAGADGAPALVVAKSFGLAFAVGAAAGLLWLFLLYLLRDADHAYPITLAGLLLLYVLIERLGASAAMGILTFAVLVGNARLIGHRVGMATDIDLGLGVRGFHSQMSFIVKSFFFVLIGALLTPPWPLLLLGVALGALLLLVRMPAVRLATLGAALERPQRALVTVALPRGLAAGVLATMPMAAGVPATDVLPVVVFATIVTTIAIFTVGLPMSARRLDAAAAPADRLEPPPAPDPATAASRSGAPE
jgi:cell volume regulation protein A